MTSLQESSKPGRSPLFIIFTTVFLDLVGFGMIIPLIGIYGRHFGATGLQLGLLGASFSLMSFLFAPIWGSLSDRFGRRPILLISLFGQAISYAGFAMAGEYHFLLATRLFAGAFAGNISTAQAYIADVTSQQDRAKGMGMIGAAFGLGFMLGPPLGGIASAKISLAAPGWIAAAICGLNAFVAYFRLPESLPVELRRKGRFHDYLPFNREKMALVHQHRYLGILLLQFFLVTFAFSNLEQTFSLLFQEKFDFATGEAGYRTGLVLMCSSFLGALIQGGLIRKLVPRFGEYQVLMVGLLMEWIGMMIFPLGSAYSQYFLIILPLSIGGALINPTLSALASKSTSPSEQGKTLGMYQGVGALARAAGPFCGLYTYGIFYGLPYAIGASCIVVVIVAGFMLKKRLPTESVIAEVRRSGT